MSQDIFNQRLARINNHSGCSATELARGEGTATSMFSSPVVETAAPGARRNLKPLLMGAVLGMIVGTIAAGLENPQMPWGPGFAYNDLIILPTLLALVAGPVMAIAGSAMRKHFPAFFFFSAAYFPCVIALALADLPLF
jgi:hypothetical protein